MTDTASNYTLQIFTNLYSLLNIHESVLVAVSQINSLSNTLAASRLLLPCHEPIIERYCIPFYRLAAQVDLSQADLRETRLIGLLIG